MREIRVEEVSKVVAQLCQEANYYLGEDVKEALKSGLSKEESPQGQGILDCILENIQLAENKQMALCQDTGMAVIFLEIGQEILLLGGDWEGAVNAGVREGYTRGYLRKSVVKDPLLRENTGDNTPAVIHYQLVPGDRLKITVAPKGFGSENMSGVKMLKPAQGVEGVKDFVLHIVKEAGPNPCPPIVVGVGLGGTMEKAAFLAKKALLRPLNQRNPRKDLGQLEEELLSKINNLGIGPQGLGGRTTALAVAVESYPTHIAGLPVAVNINCHVARHAERII